jgi:tRNA threonylcarbamoyladenosine biosynthesis protein TsaE
MGAAAVPGSVYALNGPLGSGKTVFAKGFAEGLGVAEEVTSPSFALIIEYSGRLPFFHIDLYRRASRAELEGLGLEEIFSGSAVCLVEWAERAAGLLPQGTVFVRISLNGDGSRSFETNQAARL